MEMGRRNETGKKGSLAGSPKELLALVPCGPGWEIDWEAVELSRLSFLAEQMRQIPQNPQWHGEGDVWTHTRMVCRELVSLREFQRLDRRFQEEVFLAALLHDIGKIPCTRLEAGVWTSPSHTAAGARMAREFLWLEYGFCGTGDLQNFRETVCMLIRFHSVPVHILDQRQPQRRIIKIASGGELARDFSLKLLCLLAQADMRGRLTEAGSSALELVELCREQAGELGCLEGPLGFPDSFSEYAYLSGRNIMPGQALYNDAWGEVTLMCGLPGVGKDTWIGERCPGLPMVSLDELRRELGLSPVGDQSAVAAAAREKAKGYLRSKTPFVWNATCLVTRLREGLIRLFTDYGASVRIVYLETQWEEQMRRNRGRDQAVPEEKIRRMLGEMTPPQRFEAHRVEWEI